MNYFHKLLQAIRRLFGPWPIEPAYLGGLTFFMVASLYSLGDATEINYFARGALIRPLFSVGIALLSYLQLKIITRAFPQYLNSLYLYVLLLSFQAFSIWGWIVLLRNIFPTIHSSFIAFLSPIPLLRFLFTLGCVNAFIGLSRDRLTAALHEKEKTLRIVEEQSSLLLDYDEKTRTELSEFLHDRVQTSLVTACFELKEIARDASDESRQEIDRVINNLETLRAIDVRNVSQVLTPVLGNADLHNSIEVMTKTYAPHIQVQIDISNEVEVLQGEASKEIFLGIFRIVEQSFINCAIHGQARNFQINISLQSGRLSLKTTNDGAQLPLNREKGLGTAIIDSWVRNLGGEWKIDNTAQGVALSVELPS